ncbi:hypothetical protein GA830_00140 [Mesorhizobium sp. NBSH29]|uniref:hypothetical protein n=1 Tax=Mesorhizobium sp. NBSH29 TaxID=2654249 RepID=UPI0018964B8E|nr:hypothetical protein [Mesorhizobium sp. NBSH29]QPC85322.1 hypothetical protein GA830_00140 [Mesorhizobium sp. NBSH29]
MSDVSENAKVETGRRLSDVIREVKSVAADRDDVVVDMREAQRMRLELLASELAPVFADVPDDNDWFDFVISSGLQPRLWIDAVCHVSMGRDRRTYRFLRDTRLGRVVLAESTDMKPVADQVTRYVAERIVERQRVLEGDVAALSAPVEAVPQKSHVEAAGLHDEAEPLQEIPPHLEEKSGGWSAFWFGLALVLVGAAVGLGVMIGGGTLWTKLAEFGLTF